MIYSQSDISSVQTWQHKFPSWEARDNWRKQSFLRLTSLHFGVSLEGGILSPTLMFARGLRPKVPLLGPNFEVAQDRHCINQSLSLLHPAGIPSQHWDSTATGHWTVKKPPESCDTVPTHVKIVHPKKLLKANERLCSRHCAGAVPAG